MDVHLVAPVYGGSRNLISPGTMWQRGVGFCVFFPSSRFLVFFISWSLRPLCSCPSSSLRGGFGWSDVLAVVACPCADPDDEGHCVWSGD